MKDGNGAAVVETRGRNANWSDIVCKYGDRKSVV